MASTLMAVKSDFVCSVEEPFVLRVWWCQVAPVVPATGGFDLINQLVFIVWDANNMNAKRQSCKRLVPARAG